jgi:hypothetical protein
MTDIMIWTQPSIHVAIHMTETFVTWQHEKLVLSE